MDNLTRKDVEKARALLFNGSEKLEHIPNDQALGNLCRAVIYLLIRSLEDSVK